MKRGIYKGHWAYGVSQETDQQFEGFTEFLRTVWYRERKSGLTLARAWGKVTKQIEY